MYEERNERFYKLRFYPLGVGLRDALRYDGVCAGMQRAAGVRWLLQSPSWGQQGLRSQSVSCTMVPYVGIHEARQVGLQLGVWAVGCRVQDAGCALRLTVVSLTQTAIARLQGGQDMLGYEGLRMGSPAG